MLMLGLVAAAVEQRKGAFGVGVVGPLFTIAHPGSGYPYDSTPDGQRFNLNDAEQVFGGNLKLVINRPVWARN
jgi:hypothetical protein